jgi:hypothetical protein
MLDCMNRGENLRDPSFFVPVAGILFQTATNSIGLFTRIVSGH